MDKAEVLVTHQKAHTKDSKTAQGNFNELGNQEVDELVQVRRVVLIHHEKYQLKALHIDWGHLGPRIFMKRLRQEGIPYVKMEVTDLCQQCTTCQEQKASNIGRQAGQHIKHTIPWKQIALDTMGPMKVATSVGHRYAIVGVCMATGYSVVLTSKSSNTVPVLQLLLLYLYIMILTVTILRVAIRLVIHIKQTNL